ncbi:hepatitis A virus cellular receptor 1 homolog [Acanthochromis polyacanthus]|uniref:hepatitis A virus cellular receptor 1 homolog n=1 Tax=Acanthochromis polyacanthus TaxID=80966 RepID=UPI0022347A20|nr:hepatitis A virus cellular receptor 1 homolog [Acanthochromis polyacanthus]
MFVMKIVLLLALLTASGCLSSRVDGRTGENITFTCKYNRKSYGALSVCWNLGDIPSRGMCDNQLISTDGNKVKEQSGVSSRYQLMGRLDQGDVSLTILNLRENDTGRYGCRVDIPGWFNDEKHHFDLTVKAPQVNTTTTAWTTAETSTESTPASQTEDHMMSTGRLMSSSSSVSSVSSIEDSSSLTGILVCVLFGIIVLLTAGGLFFITRRWKRLNKMPQQQISGLDQFNPSSSTLQLHSRGSAVENIYQIDGGDYEYCP